MAAHDSSALAYVRHGQTPFFRLAQASVGDDGRADYAGADAVLLGVPYDGGTTYQSGARFAPYEVRRASAVIERYHPLHRLDVFSAIEVVDGGNVAFPPFDPGAVRAAIEAEVRAVLAADAAPMLIGGDHSIALPALRAVHARFGPVAVVHVDAHLDTSGPEVWGEEFHHGSPFRHAIAEGLIERGQLHQVGIRATTGSPEADALSRAHGGLCVTASLLEDRRLRAVVRDLCETIGDRPTYVSFDVDGVDPAFAPGTGTPVPGGLTSREALALLRGLAGTRVVGMDVVEICPALDHAGLTSLLGAQVLFEGLALHALGR